MKCLVVLAHPLDNSLCQHLADKTISHLKSKGYTVTVKDLYAEHFDPVLSKEERASYYQSTFDTQQLTTDIAQLTEAQSLVLIFPTWWFGFPAILKGWFDRVWAPGYAYEHASDFGPIKQCLTNLKEMKVVTTLGSPWWVDTFILRTPVKKVLKLALLGACASNCKFQMLSLYKSEQLSQQKIDKFIMKIRSKF
ncbi:NAD(P)H-dependent oxidoreductase [Pseudoalteromonas sp. MMG013]|uniref:NAD(P)H dehydrogenase (Quinone) n=1 Tax=Pseudoalteromonas aurantia 208 TaxID=1314867 RepID=A0ABR9EC76_9GAMM|nr:NAD(P)H-dependent oxidoreductase [Pseudoalteromonas aurantia]MBE0368601.1 NAD(P)H dehydrogenase (quinone) [Pseudoalteromonas aurantia 208]MBQ4846976.1 NAD(P)H-dependent oxidoreductase [Pseudoalteromonas sp. MMG005]MBQ4862774.1 NAD(P)H-dependent oxidoreductase [Pseudoalteromonas sp. MMG013]